VVVVRIKMVLSDESRWQSNCLILVTKKSLAKNKGHAERKEEEIGPCFVLTQDRTIRNYRISFLKRFLGPT
jgi:hypothetical protein